MRSVPKTCLFALLSIHKEPKNAENIEESLFRGALKYSGTNCYTS